VDLVAVPLQALVLLNSMVAPELRGKETMVDREQRFKKLVLVVVVVLLLSEIMLVLTTVEQVALVPLIL
jgi:hypothetical protein